MRNGTDRIISTVSQGSVPRGSDEDVRFASGLMYPSDRPGLGIELNEDAATAHPKADHWLRHYVGTLTNIRPPDSAQYYHG